VHGAPRGEAEEEQHEPGREAGGGGEEARRRGHGSEPSAAAAGGRGRLARCAADGSAAGEAPARDRFAAHPGGARGFWRDVVDRVTDLAGVERVSPFAVAELFEHFARAEAWRVYPEVPAALDRLAARGLALAVVSNWDERLPRLLAALGFAERFAAIVVSAEVGVEKPHRRIFEIAAERLGVAPDRIVHVGDRRLEDVEGAEAAGLRALWLDRGGGGDLADLAALPERIAALA